MQTPLTFVQANRERHLRELIDFLQIPSISTQPERSADTRAAAEWLAKAMTEAGLEHVQIIETKRHPLIYADWLHAGDDAPTVLIYGHYDVQPADPLELWTTPPFAPDVRDDYLYARGASDDKGQVYIHVKAVEAYLQTNGRLPVNVKFIVEGEEESGGESLAAFIPQNGDLLAADIAVVSDTSILGPEQPAIVYGLRGICYLYLDITGPGHDLHSGSFGGGINNPLNVLGHIIAKLKDEDGHILIPGFYDQVRPLSDEERALINQLPLDAAKWLAETGAPAAWGEPEYTLVERLGARPTLDVHGIIGGYTGSGGKTVLPSSVHAKISMRLVPDQDPEEIRQAFVEYVQAIAPPSVHITISGGHGAKASMTPYDIPPMRAAAAAYAESFGKEPVFMREGGSIPVVGLFQAYLGLETVLMGFGLHDDRIHSPNERFYLPNYYRGIETSIRFLEKYALLNG
ncbi:MAG: dipeptidase [Anaerolineales bacterium]|nr:dipeptidase [Anaerolineales bacterium]